jgi:glycosyltransferase, group 1 family
MVDFFYVYPEAIPQKNAREISVLNTFNEIKKITNAKFISIKLNVDLDALNRDFDLNLEYDDFLFLKKAFLGFKSTVFFNFRLLSTIKDSKNSKAVFYTRHLKVAHFILKHKKQSQKLAFEAHECFSAQNLKLFEMERNILLNCDFLFMHNKSTRNELEKTFDIKLNRSMIVYNGAKIPACFTFKKIKFNAISYFGTFLLWKGVDLLLKFLQKNDDLELFLYGNEKSPSANELKKALLCTPSLQHRVKFKGFIAQNCVAIELCKNTSILIIPNKVSSYSSYSTPLKLFEYLATGNIVIAPDFPPIRELIRDGENGFLYKAQNIDDLSDKFHYIKKLDSKTLNKIARNAFETAKKYSWENRAKNIINYLGGAI